MDRVGRTALTAALLAAAMGCQPSDEPPKIVGPDDPLLDPAACEECHPQHYRDWLGSMHAYAADDPVFLAMNARGQRETNGALGDFCIQCHAPLAVELGLTTDGLNIGQVERKFKGITCYFCHTVDAVEGVHTNPLKIEFDGVMRGAIEDPVDNDFHKSRYSVFHDEGTLESAQMCGSCHDIVTPNGVHLERTYDEWLATFFSDSDPLSGGPALYGQGCGTCHMGPATVGPIADYPGVRADRNGHSHKMAAVDVVLNDYPGGDLTQELAAEQLEAINVPRLTSLCAEVCINPDPDGGTLVDVYLHNEFSAHGFPSGAAQDRRSWLELHMFDGATEVFTSGAIPEGTPVDTFEDPDLWQFRGRMLGADGEEVHMFWEAFSTDDIQLPASEVLTPSGDASTWRARRYALPGNVDRVTTALHLRPMSLFVLDDLIASGDLDPAVRDRMPTFTSPRTELEWTPDAAMDMPEYGACVVSAFEQCGASLVGAAKPE